MMDSHHNLGKTGEAQAVRYLKRLGLKILEQNYRTLRGEIDIIARDRDTLVFVEVKTRKNTDLGSPLEAVGPSKQKRIVSLAQCYLQNLKELPRLIRFDVIGITKLPEGEDSIEYLQEAFFVPDGYFE